MLLQINVIMNYEYEILHNNIDRLWAAEELIRSDFLHAARSNILDCLFSLRLELRRLQRSVLEDFIL